MIFFVDIGLFALIALIVGAGTAGAFAAWILDNLIIVLLVLMLKALLLFSDCGMFTVKENTMHVICTVVVFMLDVARNVIFLYCIAQMLGGMFSGGLFQFFLGILDVIIGGPLLFLAGEGPMYLVYEGGMGDYGSTRVAILIEIIAIIATLLVAWWGGVLW